MIKLNIHLKLQRFYRSSLGMDKLFHPSIYSTSHYLSGLGLKLIHVSKRGQRRTWVNLLIPNRNKTQSAKYLLHVSWSTARFTYSSPHEISTRFHAFFFTLFLYIFVCGFMPADFTRIFQDYFTATVATGTPMGICKYITWLHWKLMILKIETKHINAPIFDGI